MKRSALILALALGVSALSATAQDQGAGPPPGDRPPGFESGTNNITGQAGPPRRGGFHLLPPRAAEFLDLTPDQLKQLSALEAETRAKLERILTPEQMQKLNRMRPPLPRRPEGYEGGPDGVQPGAHDRAGPGAENPSGPPPQN